MGIDAMIYFTSEKENPDFEWDSLLGATYKKVDKPYEANEATHQVELSGNDRFYGKGYERGVWPSICAVLMDLFASQDITKVFYGGDSGNFYVQQITPEDVTEISIHYMKHGNRPYRIEE